MKLVIAEKPSVAMSLAAVLGATERKDGYLEGSGYLVSWCVGHLLELAQPEAYKEQYAKWRYEDLPILPENWKYEVPKDKKTQLALLCRLMKDKRVDSVVCATDAGREGELIFRLVYEYAGCKKPMERLWISSMEDAAIREGFDHLHPGSDYDKLYDAAVCRAGADWLIGINATRLFSVLYGVTLNVGRVMSPTLALLVQRESDIESFISKPFYVPEITCGGFTASGEKMTERSEAEKIRMDCDHNSAFVRSVEKQVKTIQPPRLYDLTTLQRECNRIYGYTAQQTLDYVQSLYEKKLATYPRTDSQYLTKDMQATAASLILWLRDNMPFGKGCAGEPDIDRVTDDSKVTDHHAIIPTGVPPSGLTDMEANVYDLIAKRFISIFYPDCKFSTTTVLGEVIGETDGKEQKVEFKVSGKEILEPGWRDVYAKESNNKNTDEEETDGNNSKKENVEERTLPTFVKGESGDHKPTLTEKWTTPPKYYTEASLLRAMETAGKFVEDEELRAALKENGIGRPSSRAGIIETLFKRHYIRRQRKNLVATPTGIELIDTINEELLKSCELTGIWEKKLRDIEHKTYDPADFINGLKEQINQIVKDVLSDNSARHVTITTEEDLKKKPAAKKTTARKPSATGTSQPATPAANEDPMVGKPCPLCGKGTIIKGKTAYGCSNWKEGCQYRLPFDKM